jgi:hypothetical protein
MNSSGRFSALVLTWFGRSNCLFIYVLTQGKGDGVAAAALNPKPINFSDKALMQGIPVDCHFYRISEGVQGTGMPPWKALGDDVIWKVLIYERSFAGVQ